MIYKKYALLNIYAGGAPARSGCFQHQQLRLSYVCTSATAAFAFDAFDAYGVSGFTRLCRSASSPSQHSFCTLMRRNSLGQRFHSHNNKLFSQSTHLPYHSLKDSQHIISVFRVMVFMSKLQDFLHFLTILQHQNFIYLT